VISIDTETTGNFPLDWALHKPGHGLVPGKITGIFAARKIGKSILGTASALKKLGYAFSSAADSLRDVFSREKDHRLTLGDLERTTYQERLEKAATKLAEFTGMLIHEHMLLHYGDPRKLEIVRLTKLFIKGQGTDSSGCRPNGGRPASGEHVFERLSVFDTAMGITVRLFLQRDDGGFPQHTLVYNTTGAYTAKRELNLREALLVEANWLPHLADETLQLLRRATVLDQLANV